MWKYILPVALVGTLGGFAAIHDSPACLAADAAPAKADLSLEGVDLGKAVCGPEVTAKELKGKAVVFEYWGDRCGPCLQGIPHLCEVQKTYGREKLIIVANQTWTKDVAVAKTAFESHAPKEFQVSVINHGKIAGTKVTSFPHAFVFNPDGKLNWEGHPGNPGFAKAVKEAVAMEKK